VVASHSIIATMSRKGDCCGDNAVAEKTEFVGDEI